nr:hypothetical protein [Tanacetum cinerariifolium]
MAPLTFADTYNMITFLTKSDASERFDQIVDFLNAHMIQYALMVNPTIYVSCIKQFWTTVSIKKSNDVVKLQALVDRKKVIIIEDTIRQALRLDDAAGVDCLPNEEIFAELARMGYEKPSTKLTFYKAFFLAQWNMAVEDAAEDEDDDNEVSAKPTPPSPTPATPPPSPTQEHIPSPPQVQTAQPSSPSPQQPSQTADISQSAMTPLNTLLETYATLTKQVANLKQDKIAQAIEITKLKQRVRRLAESQAKVYHLDLQHAKKVFSMQDTDEAEPAKVEEVIEVVIAAKLMTAVVTTAATTITAAQVPKASALRKRRGVVIQDPKETATASLIVHLEVKPKDKGKGILIKEPKPLKGQAQIDIDEAFTRQLEAGLNANINWDDVIEQVKRREKQDNTDMRYQALKRKPVTEAQTRKNIMIYLKNMAGFKMDFFKGMTYNKIRLIFEKHYNLIRAFLEKGEEEVIVPDEGSKRKGKHLEHDTTKKQRIDEDEEELKTHLQIIANDDDDMYIEATPLALKVPVVDYQIHHEHNNPYYKLIRADGTHQLFLSFITLLKNFNREDLETLWKLVKERFESAEPKNFLNDFFLNTLKIMYEKPNVEASVWRDQKGRYGLEKIKSWKLFKSYGVYIITLTTTQMILLVEKKYPLTHFTLEQMLNNVRLKVEKESEMHWSC